MGAGMHYPDFDTLVALHRHDPQSFDDMRRSMLRAAVESAPPEHRSTLEQLLERIENAHLEAATPIEAAQGAFGMMCESVVQLRDAWGSAQYAVAGWQAAVLIEKVRPGHGGCRS